MEVQAPANEPRLSNAVRQVRQLPADTEGAVDST